MMIPFPVVVGQLDRRPGIAPYDPDLVVGAFAGHQGHDLSGGRPGGRPGLAGPKIGKLVMRTLIVCVIIEDLDPILKAA